MTPPAWRCEQTKKENYHGASGRSPLLTNMRHRRLARVVERLLRSTPTSRNRHAPQQWRWQSVKTGNQASDHHRRHHRHDAPRISTEERRAGATARQPLWPCQTGSGAPRWKNLQECREAADRDQIVSCVDASAIHLRSKTTG